MRWGLDAGALRRGLLVAVVLTAAIVGGSHALSLFDPALTGYAVATVFAALGITYHYAVWLRRPATRRYWQRGWQFFLSWRGFRRHKWSIPTTLVENLATQQFIRPRSTYRWVMHLCIFWGVILSLLITFPLVFGWMTFRLEGESTYRLYLFGLSTISFPARSFFSFNLFHALDYTAGLLIVGCAMALMRRWRDREIRSTQQAGFDYLPLYLLIGVSVTGIGLTVVDLWFGGAFHYPITLTHQALVVFFLLYIPFGKFFHVVQRPASIGIEIYQKVSASEEPALCARCRRPFVGKMHAVDLQGVLADMRMPFATAGGGNWTDLCPACKRLAQGTTYAQLVGDRWL